MKYFYTALLVLLVILSVYLILIDNYFASLSLFILGILYVLMGRQENAKFYFYIGLLILIITFVGEFVSGYINQETIEILQKTLDTLQSNEE
tara:strand:+ start:253 stop:528 length:276 start_codon:yes stop_codon:yes gene_type:complete